jgi:hypothetical protein
VIGVEAVRVDNGILLDYLASEVAVEEPEIGSTDPNISIDNNCMDDEFHIGMPGGSRDYEDEGDESDVSDAIPTASQQWWPATELKRFELGTSHVDGYEGEDGDDVDADEEEDALQADDESMQHVEDWGHSWCDLGTSDVDGYEGEDGNDGDGNEEESTSQVDDVSMQNVEDRGHSTRDCEDSTIYFKPVKYDNGEANATASEVSAVKTVLQYVKLIIYGASAISNI